MSLLYIIAAVNYTGNLPKPSANDSTLNTVLNIVFGLTASIALLMIVIGGFRYITAHGNSTATSQAKDTILYAIIGLIITMVAYGIVTFVIRMVI